MNKKTLIALVGFLVLSMTVVGSNNIYAQTNPSRQTVVDMLVSKFGLKKAEVESVFTDFQKQHQADMMAGFKTRLSQLVKDGKLTQTQSDLILKKHDELIAQKDSTTWQNLTPQERRAKMDQQRRDLEKWAADNKIDIQYLPFIGGKGRRGFGGHGSGMDRWNNTQK
jgi:hypothetical protein